MRERQGKKAEVSWRSREEEKEAKSGRLEKSNTQTRKSYTGKKNHFSTFQTVFENYFKLKRLICVLK